MSGKHTPGPWKAVRCEHGWHIGPQPDGVCSIGDNTDGSHYPEHEANARLIAQAPDVLRQRNDMLAAMQWMIAAMHESCGDAWCAIREQPGAVEGMKRFHAAIASVNPATNGTEERDAAPTDN